MNLRDLITERSGHLSHSKLWSNTASLLLSIVFVYEATQGRMSEWLFLTYGGLFISGRVANKFMEKKNGDDINS